MNCALVTGGSRGIGKAICIRLAALGYHVLINYKSNIAEADDTLKTIREKNGSGELLPFDVGNRQEITEILGGWLEKHKEDTVEVLVNNAGIKDDVLMMWMKDEQWENVLRTNLDSFFYITRLVISSMLMKRYGRIINVVSLSGQKGLPGQTNYAAAKGGLIAATKALAQEVGRRGITVNAVAPGFIKTDMTQSIPEKEMKALIPVNRFGTPEEVAHAVAFLVSPDSGYITGEVLSINGGMYS
jgi:3-oxoacyl-[acyl-carrier protein] reductase